MVMLVRSYSTGMLVGLHQISPMSGLAESGHTFNLRFLRHLAYTLDCVFAVILCPILPDPPNGFIIMTNGNNIVGSIANYFCVMGFMTRPGDVITRRCMENREWSGTEPLCLRMSAATIDN